MNILLKTKEHVKETLDRINPETGLIRSYCNPNYHSNLEPGEYHFIVESTNLALGIFATGYEEYYHEANEVLRKVIPCQCREGEFTGIWPYFLEESLEEMVAPDWNYADFEALPMVIILKEYSDKLEDGMCEMLEEACLYACRAIIKRNLTVLYTNPTVMGIYIMFMCGELFNKPELIKYGMKKLKDFYVQTIYFGTYNEYNCPGYTKLILDFYSLMLRHIKNEEALRMLNELNIIAWKMMGEHYHNPTGEFTGPKFRQYGNFIKQNEMTIWQRSVGKTLDLIKDGDEKYSDYDLIYDLKCPEEIKPLFTDEKKETEFRRILSLGHTYPHLGWHHVDTQYIKPEFTLGSYSGMDSWNQHHNVVSYIGTREKKCCIRMRAYHDGYDFASAYMNTVQEKGTAMTLINFHTNRGDTHHDLDPIIDSKIKATDFRIRYQIEANTGGITDNIQIEEFENGCRMNVLGIPVEIKYHYAEMSGEKPYFEIVKEENCIWVDMVLYHGDEKEIDFDKLESLVTISHISVNETAEGKPEISKDDRYIYAKWNINGLDTEIKSQYKPLEQIHSVLGNEIKINGVNLIKYIQENT